MTKRTNRAAKAGPSRSDEGPAQYLPVLARAEANRRRKPASPLRWSAAIEEAPWLPHFPAAWETEFRRAYAAALVERGFATEAAPSGSRSTVSGATKLARYQVSQTDEEHRAQAARAKAAGLGWAQWARRKLAE